MEEETIARLTTPDEYAYHIGQVASVGAATLKVVRKQFSIREPYTLEMIPMSGISHVAYTKGRAPVRMVLGVLLLALLAGMVYFLVVYWDRLETRDYGWSLLGLAGVYGLRWAFMSRRHELIFHLNDGGRLIWRSRSGDFKLKERAVDHVVNHFRARGRLMENMERG